MPAFLIPILSLCVGTIILDIWYRIGKTAIHNQNLSISAIAKTDYGLLFLAISLIVWFITGSLTKLIIDDNNKKLIRSCFSTLNSVFLLISVGYFEYVPAIIRKNQTRFNQIISIAAIITLVSIVYLFNKKNLSSIFVPDFVFSLPTVAIISYVYFLTFYNRKFKLLAFFTLLILGLLLASQPLPLEYFKRITTYDISSLIGPFSRLSFIFIICFLGYSWEHERYSKVLNEYNANIDRYFDISEERNRIIATSSSSALESVWKEVSLKAAHKIGNPLDAIEVYIDSLEKNINKHVNEHQNKKIQKIINNTKEKIGKAKRLIQEFKIFGGHMELKKQDCDLIQIINSSSEIVSENNVTFELVNSSSFERYVVKENAILGRLPGVNLRIDAEKVRDCFDELFSNSLKWLKNDRTNKIVKISVEDCNEEDALTIGIPILDCKKYIKVIYMDNAKGIKEENKKLIFAPFFTTDSQGTGMGLPIVKKIIKLHDGFIYENGEHGKGVRFIILLPKN